MAVLTMDIGNSLINMLLIHMRKLKPLLNLEKMLNEFGEKEGDYL